MSREKVANKISDIFNPYYSSAPFFLLVALAATNNLTQGLILWLPLALFFSALPMWDIKRRIRRGLVKDAHISRREDRIKPFLFSLGCAVLGLVAVYALSAPPTVKAVAWAVVINGAFITAITAVWKVSLHAAGITSISLILVYVCGLLAAPVALFIPVVFWARLILKKHTLAQLIVGTALSAAIVTAVFWRFDLL